MATEQQHANGALSDEQWKALCRDIADRRGLKWEWAIIDDDVKLDIRAAWSKILANRPASYTLAEIVAAYREEFYTDDRARQDYNLSLLFARLTAPKAKTAEEPHVESSGSGTFDVRCGGTYLANFVSKSEADKYTATLKEREAHNGN